jgi:hypothetical protein
MIQPAETLQLSPEEQGRLLARVYAYILSDQFTGTKQEPGKKSDEPSTKKRKERTTGDTSVLDVATADSKDPKE